MTVNELLSLIKTEDSIYRLNERRNDLAEVIPQLRSMFDYDQMSKYHQYDLWMHTLYVLTGLPRGIDDDMLYLAALLHDIGKPRTQCKGKRSDDPYMHYYNHERASADITEYEIMPALYSQGLIIPIFSHKRLIYYISKHDAKVKPEAGIILQYIDGYDNQCLVNLMYLQIADAKAHIESAELAERINSCNEIISRMEKNTYE